MLRASLSVALLLLVASPASAADEATCADQFKGADLNNDGALSSTEIGNAKDKVPAGISGRDRVSRIDFMAACTNSI
jgi:hypothetical protein